MADLVLSVVPPDRALEAGRDLAAALARTGAAPLVVDANAVSPATVARLAALLPDLVDGSISGGPPAACDDPLTRPTCPVRAAARSRPSPLDRPGLVRRLAPEV